MTMTSYCQASGCNTTIPHDAKYCPSHSTYETTRVGYLPSNADGLTTNVITSQPRREPTYSTYEGCCCECYCADNSFCCCCCNTDPDDGGCIGSCVDSCNGWDD